MSKTKVALVMPEAGALALLEQDGQAAKEFAREALAPRTGASSPRPLYLTECLLIGPKENAA
jgi:hypothetical protein